MRGSRSIQVCFLLLFIGGLLQAQTVFRGKVIDEISKQPIGHAKVGISDHGVGVITNQNGSFSYKKYNQTLGDHSELKITAYGYEDLVLKGSEIRAFYNKSGKFALKKAEQTLDSEVVNAVNSIALFWDASLSSANRDFNKEWDFLEAYFQDLGTLKLSFLVFNEAIVKKKEFTVNKDISALKQYVENIEYTGATSYEILPVLEVDKTILLSDGNPVLGEWKGTRKIPYYAITSIARANSKFLKSLALYTSGSYINLSLASIAQGIDQIKNNIPFIEQITHKAPSITGSVSTSIGPIQAASIIIKGDLEEYFTKSDGSFKIPAAQGDIVQIRYIGMYPKEMVVKGNELKVVLTPLDELLEEVVLKGRKGKKQNKRDAGFGEIDEDAIGFAVNTITSKDIGLGAVTITDIIKGRFAGVTVSGYGNAATFSIRGADADRPAIWVVDGSIYNEPPLFVEPQDIQSISIVKSIQASLRYGSLAAGGAFIIRTKSFASRNQSGEIVDQALVKENDYTEHLEQINLEILKPDYVKHVQQIESKEKQYVFYTNLAKANTTNATFFIDMALFFEKSYPEKAKEVRSRLAEIAQGNAKVLRVLAYLYENAQDYKNALKTYERVALLAPGEAQSYRDLAKAYKETAHYDKSLELYINMLSEQIIGVDFTPIDKALGHELLHLVSRHRDQIDYKRLPEEWLPDEYAIDLRMVIEWSDPTTPFEFQFVNPQDKYFKWNHTLFDNKERLEKEVKAGFQFEEFLIDDAPHGLWIVNIEYLGKDKHTTIPPYLKYTIYRDYGTAKERKETIIIKLSTEIGKAQLHEFLL